MAQLDDDLCVTKEERLATHAHEFHLPASLRLDEVRKLTNLCVAEWELLFATHARYGSTIMHIHDS